MRLSRKAGLITWPFDLNTPTTMGATPGNQFWKLRSKHGRDKLFQTPELLWEAATEYFQWCQDNPWIKIDFRGKDAVRVEIPFDRPFTITGLCLYLDCNSAYFRNFKANLKESDKDFSTVITRIEDTIYTQKFEGAAVGTYNANIIARDLGLREEIKHEGLPDPLIMVNITKPTEE